VSSFAFMRSIARFFGSIFFPFFRAWGETVIRTDRGCVYIARNYGLLTWLSSLRIFRRPVRFVLADAADTTIWFELAVSCGLEPIKLSGDVNQDFLSIEHLFNNKETIVLLIPETPDRQVLELIAKIKATHYLVAMFMAISGARLALKPGSMIPRVCPVSVFCGMPHYRSEGQSEPLGELEFLERAISDIPLNELPSIFSNHSRNS